MTVSDTSIDILLDRLDSEARKQPYPPQGLPIHGPHNDRELYRLLVRTWISEHSPEALKGIPLDQPSRLSVNSPEASQA